MIGLHDEIIRFATLKMISFCTSSRQSALFTKCSNQCWSMHIINLNQQVHFLFPYGDGLAASLVAHRQRRNRQNLWMQMQKQTKNDFYITAKPFEFKFSCFFHIPELDSMRTSSTFAPIYWWLNFWTCHLDTVFIGLCVIFFFVCFLRANSIVLLHHIKIVCDTVIGLAFVYVRSTYIRNDGDKIMKNRTLNQNLKQFLSPTRKRWINRLDFFCFFATLVRWNYASPITKHINQQKRRLTVK